MAKTVTIRISAEDNFSAVMQKYNQAVGDAGTKTKTFGDESKPAESNLNKLNGALQTAVGIFAAMKSAEFVADIINLGRESNKTKDVFNNLLAPLGGAQETMDKLHTATGGVVDDMTLMQGANKLVQMGLATTSDEVARMSEMAVKLGSSMGMDATKSMSDFALLLANKSILRLDQFGISGSRVRAEMNELLKTGKALDSEEAFKLAVMDIGTKALNRLGDAANAASTPLARLETRVQNFTQDFASRAATGAEGIIGLVEIATGNNPIQVQQREAGQAAAKAFTDEYQAWFSEYMSMSGAVPAATMEKLGGDAGRALMDGLYQATLNPSVESPGEALMRIAGIHPGTDEGKAIIDSFTATYEQAQAAADNIAANVKTDEANQRWQNMMAGIFGAPGEMWRGGENFLQNILQTADESGVLKQAEKEHKAWQERQESATEYFNNTLASARTFVSNVNTALDTIPQHLLAMGQVGTAVRGMQADIASVMGTAFMYQPGAAPSDLSALTSGGIQSFQMPQLPQYMTPEQATTIREQFQQATLEVERLQGLADAGLIQDADLERAKGLKDNLGLMADEADRAAKAFEDLRLSDIFGTTGGGMSGEITDLVIQQMKEAGKSPEQIAAMQRALDLQSGRETTSSLYMKEQLAPQLAGMSPEQAALAQANLSAAMGQSALMGYQPWQMTNMGAMMGMGANGQVIPGMNPQVLAMLGAGQGMNILQGGVSGLWSMFGGTTGEGAGMLGGLMGLLGGGKEGEGGGLDKMSESMSTASQSMTDMDMAAGGVQEKTAAVSSNLADGMASITEIASQFKSIEGTHNVTLNVSLTGVDPAVLAALGISPTGGTTTGQQVRNNGGRVPGQTSRTHNR